MTLDELLRMPLMKGAQVIAGEQGTGAEVTWCVPDTRLDLGASITPGFLLLYTGGVADQTFGEYLASVLPSLPSGVVLGGGFGAIELTDGELALCEANDLPLIRMPDMLNTLSFSKRFASVIAKNFGDRQRTEEWLRALCYSGSYYSNEAPEGVLDGAGDLERRCLYVRNRDLDTKDDVQAEMETNIALDLLTRELTADGNKPLAFAERGAYVACFVPVPAEATKKEFDDRVRSAISRLRKLTNIKWLGSVGTVAHDPTEFHQSFSDAVRTSEVVTALGAHEHVSFYDDWYMHMLLLQEPKAELREHMDHVLAPILDNEELVETLANYLTFGESLKTTSERMFIHVNTLKYRLARISELLKCDLKDPNVRFRLRMAITIERYLRAG